MAIPEYPVAKAQSPTRHSGVEEGDHGALPAVTFLHLKFPSPEKENSHENKKARSMPQHDKALFAADIQLAARAKLTGACKANIVEKL